LTAPLPNRCPSCRSELEVRALCCSQCATSVEGHFRLSRFCQLDGEQFGLLDLFLRSRGNVKEVERELGLSYPTVRAKLDQLWIQLGYREDPNARPPVSAKDIVDSLSEGALDVEEAIERLKSRRT